MNDLLEPTVLFSEGDLQTRVKLLGRRITDDYTGKEVALVGILPNAIVFMADLIRHIERPLTCDFLKMGTSSSKVVEIAFGNRTDFRDRDVLLLQGVADTGITLSFITGHITEDWKPRSLRVAALIDRNNHRKVDSPVDYACFNLEKEGFVVGYGLAYKEQYRGVPYIGLLDKARPAFGRDKEPDDGDQDDRSGALSSGEHE